MDIDGSMNTRHGANSGIGYLKKGIWSEKFWSGNSFLQQNLNHKLIYHFYYINTYIWCYQYTGTKMIQNFGSFYIYTSDTHTDCGTQCECLTN